MTSCFTAVVFVPRADENVGLAPGRASRGYAYRLGKADNLNVGSWRSARATAPRVLLVAHSRGALELPGGKRDKGEMLADAAARELLEETGVTLQPSLSTSDAILARVVNAGEPSSYPRWLVFVRIVSDAAVFDAAVAAAPKGAKGYPIETWGNVAAPLWIEGEREGCPKVLAAMPPWQAEMLLSALVASGVLVEEEAVQLAKAADKYVLMGGARKRKNDEFVPHSLEDSITQSVASLSLCHEMEAKTGV